MAKSNWAWTRVAGVLGAALIASACGDSNDEVSASRANILLVTLDTVRADYLGSYGYEHDISPNFDALAADGTQFENAISSASVTPVSHASILTGRIPPAHGLRVLSAGSSFRMNEDVETLANIVQAAGYRTGAVHSSFTVSSYFGFDRGFDFFESFDTSLHEEGKFVDWKVKQNQRRADATTDIAIDFLDAGKDPFFLWVHYWDMHDAMLLPDLEFMPPDTELAKNRRGVIQPNAALYAAEIRFMDHHLGRLLAALEKRGHKDDTLIVIVSDHGEGLGDHGWAFHRLLYQEQIRVPLVFRIPGVTGGEKRDGVVRTIDILPTVLDYVEIAPPGNIQGRSLRALIEGKSESGRMAYSEQINLFDKNAKMIQRRPNDALLHSLQDQEWKLTYRPLHPRRSELFNLADDPEEKQNLFRVDHPEAIRLLTQIAHLSPWVKQAPSGEGMDPAARAQLEALGYVQKSEDEEARPIAWSYSPIDALDRKHFATQEECLDVAQTACVLIRTPTRAR